MRPKKFGPLVVIEWRDHCGSEGSGWKYLEDVENMKPSTVSTVGWVIKETKEFVTVASIISDHFLMGDICLIKKNIISRRTIK